MKECPHCGNDDAYEYTIYGAKMVYTGIFKDGRHSEECAEILYDVPPVLAKCGSCGKFVRLSDIDEN